jgi:hypothetical protein
MIVDIVKYLLDKPQKLTQGIITCLQYLFAILLSIVLYNRLYDTVSFGELSEWSFWIKWLVTGKVLIWIFLYVFSYRFLFDCLPLATVGLLQLAGRGLVKPLKMNMEMLKTALSVLDKIHLLDFDRETDRLKATKFTPKMAEFLETLDADEPEEDDPLFSAYLQVWHLLVLFAVVYFFHGFKWDGHVWLTMFIGLGLILLPAGYLVGNWIYHVLVDRRDELLFAVRGLEFDRQLEAALCKMKYPITERIGPDGKSRWRELFYQGQIYRYHFCWVQGYLTLPIITDIIADKLHGERRLLLVTNGTLGPGVKQTIEGTNGLLTLLIIPTEDDIPVVVEKAFPSEHPTKYLF